MTKDEIIRWAREAGFGDGIVEFIGLQVFERFAALVAAAKESEFAERLRTDVHSCHDNCQRVTCVAVREAVAAEREACAMVCDEMAKGYEERSARPEKDRDINPEVARIAVMTCGFVVAAIRARDNNA